MMSFSSDHPHWETALHVAPLLHLDRQEPFRPVRVGITFFEQTAPSQSFDRIVTVDSSHVRLIIEYAIYWDYDIQHLYDLEHVWVAVGHDGEIVACEASYHGQYLIGLLRDRSNLTADRRVKLFVQPGKHAMAPLKEVFELTPNPDSCCLEDAGKDGVLENALFKGQFKLIEDADRLAEKHLRTFRFQPAFEYEPYEWEPDVFVSWDELKLEIPVRMKALLAKLAQEDGVASDPTVQP